MTTRTDPTAGTAEKPDTAQPPAADGPPPLALADRAIRNPLSILLFFAICALLLWADLHSKHAVFDTLLNDPELIARAEAFRVQLVEQDNPYYVLHQFQRQVCPGVKLTLSANPGVVFGLSLPRWAVVVATVLAVLMVGGSFATSDRRARLLHVSLACILAGALGNLYDRLFSRIAPLGLGPIERNVRDFIDLSELHYPWVFNLADVWLVAGVILLCVHWIWQEVKRKRSATAESDGPGT